MAAATWPNAIRSGAAAATNTGASSVASNGSRLPAPAGGAGVGPGIGSITAAAMSIAFPAGPAPLGVPGRGWIVTTSAPLAIHSSDGGPVVETLGATNQFSNPTTLGVIGIPSHDWAAVILPQRPNGSTGWVHTPDVAVTWTPYSIEVSRAARSLTVLRGDQAIFSSPVSVGRAGAPTPSGTTYLYESIPMMPANGPYGPFIFGLALFSNSYQSWNGQVPQIGIHGNDDPGGIGHPISHGCIRLPNAAITQLSTLLPLGTPVTVT
ncbi:MAG: L,D-transpeptidase [Acidimicrobiales bacterium]